MLCELPDRSYFNTKYIVTMSEFVPEYGGHLIYLRDGSQIFLDEEDFRVLEEVLVKEEGLMMPYPPENDKYAWRESFKEEAPSNDPRPKDGKGSTE